MPSSHSISPTTLARLIGTPAAPPLIDEAGGATAHAATARLRHDGVVAEVRNGGQTVWAMAGLPLVPEAARVPHQPRGGKI